MPAPPPGREVASPEAPPSLAAVLNTGAEAFFDANHQFAGYRELPGWVPPVLDEDQRRAALAFKVALERFLMPGDPGAIAYRVAGLLGHWRAAEQDSAVLDVMADDWQRALGRFPEWAVDLACEEWVDFHHYRPQVSDIRALCENLVRHDRLKLRLVEKLLREAEAGPHESGRFRDYPHP